MEREQIRVVTSIGIDDFQNQLDELTEDGWDLEHGSVRVSDQGVLVAVMRKYPQPNLREMVEPIDEEEERKKPTPYDGIIAKAKKRIDEAPTDEIRKANADQLMSLVQKRDDWRYMMRANPELG